MNVERAQPVALGIDKDGELVWGVIEMPRWQKKMFPVRYTGDFSGFWMKLQVAQDLSMEFDGENMDDFKSYIPWQVAYKYPPKQHHKGD